MTEVPWSVVPNGTDAAFLAGLGSLWGNSTVASTAAVSSSFRCALTKTGFSPHLHLNRKFLGWFSSVYAKLAGL